MEGGHFENNFYKQEMKDGAAKPLFCDCVGKAYSNVVMGFSFKDTSCVVQSFNDYYINEFGSLGNFDSEDQRVIDELNRLAQEANDTLRNEDLEFVDKVLKFFKIAIRAAEVACSEESKKRYESMLSDFRKKQELT